MLTIDTKSLIGKKNLLAFSAGVDSSALFFLLLEHKIIFDIAIVNYGTRDNSDTEEAHAKALAKKYQLICHSIKAPMFNTHFEQQARAFRYDFFESLIDLEGYDNLLTAHQLNDQLEWLLMRLCKGAGASELIGLSAYSTRENYNLYRPLLAYSKEELLDYLNRYEYPYFIDKSNLDEKYERNKFRKEYANGLLAEYKEGISRSIDYLRKDKENLESGFTIIYKEKLLHVVKLHNNTSKVRAIDTSLKQLGYLLSASQRVEIEKCNSMVIGGLWAIEKKDMTLYISPYILTPMPKKFKEYCRIHAIPSKIRGYCFQNNISMTEF